MFKLLVFLHVETFLIFTYRKETEDKVVVQVVATLPGENTQRNVCRSSLSFYY